MTKKDRENPMRSVVYVVGVCTLAVGTLGFLAGFASPYWHFSRKEGGGTQVNGLWVTCDQESGTLSNCRQNIVRAEDWLRGIQFLQSSAALLLLLACVAVVLNSFARKPVYRRLTKIPAVFGAIFAVFGTLGYLLFTLSPPSQDSNFMTFTWGFGVNVTGSLLCVLAAILIGVCRAPPGDKESKGENSPATSKGQNPYWLTESSRSGVGLPASPEEQVDTNLDRKSWLLPPELHWASNAKA